LNVSETESYSELPEVRKTNWGKIFSEDTWRSSPDVADPPSQLVISKRAERKSRPLKAFMIFST